MVRYATAAGNAAAARNARGKHFVIFDAPGDKGPELKKKQPDLGWAEDIEGHPTLPFSVAARLLLPPVVVRDDRGASLFSHFVTDQLLNRVWGTVIPHLNLGADDIFSAVIQAADAAASKTPLVSVAGDWADCEGLPAGDGLSRWVPAMTRGDAFSAQHDGAPGIVAAELCYYMGPYMRTAQRADGTHFSTAARTIGKLFQSDEDEDVVDAGQLAADVAGGLRDSKWPPLLMTTPPSCQNERSVFGGSHHLL